MLISRPREYSCLYLEVVVAVVFRSFVVSFAFFIPKFVSQCVASVLMIVPVSLDIACVTLLLI